MVNDLDEASAHSEELGPQTRSRLGRPRRKLRGRDSRTGAPRHRSRFAHRPNQRPRSRRRLHPAGSRRRPSRRASQEPIPPSTKSVRSIPWRSHVEGMLALQKMGAVTFDYGNNIRTFAFQQGVKNAYDFPGFVPPTFARSSAKARGPFRWAALSGEPSDIHRTDKLVLEMFPHDEILCRWIELAQKRVRFQGLPARICWLGYGERDQFGVALNDLVAQRRIESSDRHRSRSSRLRLGRFALSRNRKNARRLRRRR